MKNYLKIDFLKGTVSAILIVVSLILLVLVLKIGVESHGAKRWFVIKSAIGSISFQPSLLAKLALIVFVADFVEKNEEFLSDVDAKTFFSKFGLMIIVILAVWGLVIAEKHLSIIIISVSTVFWMLWFTKIKRSNLILSFFVLFLLAVIYIFAGNSFRIARTYSLLEYSPILKIFDLNKTPTNKSFNTRESLIAISRGNILGQREKTISQKAHLPEKETDYIFGVIGEKYGFLGSFFVLSIYVVFFLATIPIIARQQEIFPKLLAVGLSMNIYTNALVNIGVVVCALPATGVTLPFISRGGTSILINSICYGMLLGLNERPVMPPRISNYRKKISANIRRPKRISKRRTLR